MEVILLFLHPYRQEMVDLIDLFANVPFLNFQSIDKAGQLSLSSLSSSSVASSSSSLSPFTSDVNNIDQKQQQPHSHVEILVQDKDRELLFLKPDFSMDDGIIIRNVLLWMERLDAAQKYAYDGEETSS